MTETAITVDSSIEGFALSPAQRRLWLLHARAPMACPAQGVFCFEGEVETKRLHDAITETVGRHEILRTRYRSLPGIAVPLQVITEASDFSWRYVDLSDSKDAERQAALVAWLETERERSFDLETEPLLRVVWVTLSAQRSYLIVTLPSLAADRRTLLSLVAEIARVYAGDAGPRDDVAQYVDVAQWQNELLESEEGRAAAAFWEEQAVPGFFAERLPLTSKTGGAETFQPLSIGSRLSREVSERLDARAREIGTAPATLLLATWQLLLRRLTGRAETVVGCFADGRRVAQLREALGLFGRYLPIRLRVSEDFLFSEVVRRVGRSFQAVSERQELFSWERYALAAGLDDESAFFPFLFDFEEASEELSFNGLRVYEERCSWTIERFCVRLSVLRESADYSFEWHYDPVLHDEIELRRLAGRFETLLSSALAKPQSQVAELEVLSAEERVLLASWRSTRSEVSQQRSLAALFEAQVERLPANAVALVWEGGELGFGELNTRANRVAWQLRRLGVGPESRVALYFERSAEQIVALLGVWKSGAAYVPLDPEQPRERLALVLEDSGAEVVLSQAALRAELPGDRPAIFLDADRDALEREPAENLGVEVLPHHLAYVIYTSGSTGRPKGALIGQGSVKNLLQALEAAVYSELPAEPAVRVAVNASLGFDASVKQVIQLLNGRCLALVPGEVRPDGAALLAWLGRHRVDVLDATPSQLRLMLEVGLGGASFPRRVLVGGEAIDPGLWQRLADDPEQRFFNVYGPTECTVDTTACRIAAGTTPSLGRALTNVGLEILDARLRRLPVGMAGELVIGGAGVARGYLGRAGLSAERFVPDPFAGEAGARMYRSGDQARFLADGQVEYLGRQDGQVKLRGVRLELGEVELALAQHPGVAEAVAVVCEEPPMGRRLVAYVTRDRRYAELLASGRHMTLPNGMQVMHQNRNETTYLYQEIFVDRCYVKHGIFLPDDACIFDIGANIGMFTLFAQSECARPRIFAFEPLAPIFEMLKLNCALHMTPARLFPFGLSSSERIERFNYYPRYSMMSSQLGYARPESEAAVVKRFLHNELESGAAGAAELLEAADELLEKRFEGEVVEARLRRLSNVLRAERVERIDLLKIDVQRAELDVLQGIDEDDWAKIDQVVMEAHDAPDEETAGRLELLRKLLENRGFKVVAEQDPLLLGTDRFNLYAVHPRSLARRADAPAGDARRSPEENVIKGALEVSPGALRESLRRRLPEVMVPAAIVMLERLPLNANGKVDRKALPVPQEVEEGEDRSDEQARTPTEEMLAAIWTELLGVERVDLHKSFFELGGHSLLATQVMSRVRSAFQVELPLRTLFEKPTLEALAREVEAAMRRGHGLAAPPIRPVPRYGPQTAELPLSFAQQRLWFLQELVPEDFSYNSARAMRLRGRLSARVVEATLAEIVRRHEVLRTLFRRTTGGAVQEIRPANEWSLWKVDLAHLPEASREAELGRLARAEARRAFDLGRDLPLRVTLLRLGPEEHGLFFTLHHVAADGWSLGVLVHEITVLYEAFGHGRPSPLPELPIQVADFARWQRSWLQGETLDRFLGYWRRRLGGELPVSRLPTDHPWRSTETHRGAQSHFALAPELSTALIQLSRQQGVTLFMATLAGFVALLARLGEQDDVIVGTAIAGRNRGETEGLIGFFINMLPLRIDLSGNPTFLELLSQVREVTLGAYAHQDMPFDKLVEELQPERAPDRAPIFQIAFGFRNAPSEALALPGLEVAPLGVVNETARFDLTVWMGEYGGRLSATWHYDRDLFEPATIERFESKLEALLESAVGDPGVRIASLRLLGETEQQAKEAEKQDREAANLARLRGARRQRVGEVR